MSLYAGPAPKVDAPIRGSTPTPNLKLRPSSGPSRAGNSLRILMAVLASATALTMSPVAVARDAVSVDEAVVVLAALPPEARTTHSLILSGGPFPYDKDGTVFGNRERLLPIKPRGFYREYTVKTPRSRDRGARRIVCGGEPPAKPEVCYYTADHYASFARIVP